MAKADFIFLNQSIFLERLILAVSCHGYPMWLHVQRSKWWHGGKGKSKTDNSKDLLLPCGAPWSPCTYIFFTLHGDTHRILFFRLRNSPRKMTEIRGQTDSHSHLLFLAISPIPIPPLHQPSYQNKIVISTAEASPFYWRLSDVHVIMSDLGFDRPTRERLVLQGESMAQGHIPINRLPQLFCSCSPLCDR